MNKDDVKKLMIKNYESTGSLNDALGLTIQAIVNEYVDRPESPDQLILHVTDLYCMALDAPSIYMI